MQSIPGRFGVIDILGKKFGKLTVLERVGSIGKLAAWLVECECGTRKIIRGSSLRSGVTKSCGCLKIEAAKKAGEANIIHGDKGTNFYKRYRSMIERCGTKYYEDIDVCEEWRGDYLVFKRDMYLGYLIHIHFWGVRNTTLDRVDPYEGYSPRNCRWATYKTQNNNRRFQYEFD